MKQPVKVLLMSACAQSTASLSCDSNGELVIDGCDSSLQPFVVCTACLPSVNHDACDACMAGSCCAQSKALLSASDVLTLISCNEACPSNDQACAQSCLANSPEAAAALPAWSSCRGASCSAACK